MSDDKKEQFKVGDLVNPNMKFVVNLCGADCTPETQLLRTGFKVREVLELIGVVYQTNALGEEYTPHYRIEWQSEEWQKHFPKSPWSQDYLKKALE